MIFIMRSFVALSKFSGQFLVKHFKRFEFSFLFSSLLLLFVSFFFLQRLPLTLEPAHSKLEFDGGQSEENR